MKVGDAAFYYHSQEGLAVGGIAQGGRASGSPDPSDPSGRFVAVELGAGGALPKQPVTLARDQGDAERWPA